MSIKMAWEEITELYPIVSTNVNLEPEEIIKNLQ